MRYPSWPQIPPKDMEGTSLWPECLRRLSAQIPEADMVKFLMPLAAEPTTEGLTLLAPNELVRRQVRERFQGSIQRVASEILGYDLSLSVIIGAGAPKSVSPAVELSALPQTKPDAAEEAPPIPLGNNLNPSYTLDGYVEGPSNRNARAAALYVAQQPGGNYNPLLIYGETGLGKTHLMQAVGHAIAQANPKARVVYIGAEQWLNHFTRAIREGRIDDFKNFYRTANVLLIDDIHFIANKDRTQEEFFHTFNALVEARAQIVMTCDRFPRELDGLDDRLKTRFAWGLSVQVAPPDLETRAAILIAKAELRNLVLPHNVAMMIAQRVRSNVRELEGALKRLEAVSTMTGRAVTLEFANDCLRDMLAVYDRAVSLDSIKKEVATFYKLPLRDLLSKRRSANIARPRQVAMSLAKELTQHSLMEIGDAFERDHTTVMHACDKIKELRESDARVKEDYETLLRKLNA